MTICRHGVMESAIGRCAMETASWYDSNSNSGDGGGGAA